MKCDGSVMLRLVMYWKGLVLYCVGNEWKSRVKELYCQVREVLS